MYRPVNCFVTTLFVLLFAVDAMASEVNVYSARKESLIKPLLDKFSLETGIQTNLITAKADKLLTRMINEGANTPADLLITTDAGRLYRARQANLLQKINSPSLDALIPAHLKDADGYWVGLSQRARVIFYAPDRVDPAELSTYEDLADPRWIKRICIRGSDNIYNQSLVASMLAANGLAATQRWADGLVKNLARPPQGGDRDQIKAAAAGVCDIAIVNTYYYARMLENTRQASEVAAAQKMKLFWPNQDGRGAHVNVSGAAISKYSKNRDNAIRLLEFMLTAEAQAWYASVNYEYPVRVGVEPGGLIAEWGRFKSDVLNLSRLGELNTEAVKIMDRAGWK